MSTTRFTGRLYKKDLDKEKDVAEFLKLSKEFEESESPYKGKRVPKVPFNLKNYTSTGGSKGMYAGRIAKKVPLHKRKMGSYIPTPERTQMPHFGCDTLSDFDGNTPALLKSMKGEIDHMLSQLTVFQTSGQEVLPKRKQTSVERRVNNENSWHDIRPSLMDGYTRLEGDIFDDQVCQLCSDYENVKIRCLTCCTVCCVKCDASLHTFNALHDRIGKAADGRILSLASNQTFDEAGTVVSEGVYIFKTDVFDFLDNLKRYLPSVSVFAFVNSLDDMTQTRQKTPLINPTAFSEAFSEYRRCKYAFQKDLGVESFSCPACDGNYHAVHVDGIMKLYRFFSTNKTTQSSYFGEDFLSSKGRVETLVDLVRSSHRPLSKEKEESIASCGDATFSAAKDKPARYRSLDETGLCSACCRHGVMLSAVNMYRGEIFAYPLSVQVALADRGIFPKFLCQDVVCKYYPWLISTAARFPENNTFQLIKMSKPFLSVFHAKTHNTTCQLLRGGRTVPGSANQTGEEMEQVHADIARLQQITKRMRPELRDETITLHAAAHNSKKIKRLPEFLYERLSKTLYEHKELHSVMTSIGKSRSELLDLKREVQEKAQLVDATPHPRKLNASQLEQVQRFFSSNSECVPDTQLRSLLNHHLSWVEAQVQKKDIAIAQTRQELTVVSDTSKRRFVLRQRMTRSTNDRKPIAEEAQALKAALIRIGCYDSTFVNENDPSVLATMHLFDQVVRLEEEVPLIAAELNQYAKYFDRQVNALQSRIHGFDEGSSSSTSTGIYALSGADEHAITAFRGLLLRRRAECVTLRDNAVNFLIASRNISEVFLEERSAEYENENEQSCDSEKYDSEDDVNDDDEFVYTVEC